MDIINFFLGTLFGILVTQLVQHLLAKSRDKEKSIPEIGKAFLEEINTIDDEMNTVRRFDSPLEAIGVMRKFELGSVKYTAFKKTCTRKQQEELDIAYNNYKTSEANDKYKSLINLKNLVENIINSRVE